MSADVYIGKHGTCICVCYLYCCDKMQGSMHSVHFGVNSAPSLGGFWSGMPPQKFFEKYIRLDAVSCNLGVFSKEIFIST